MPIDINFMIGGEAGQGIQSAGSILAKALARGGFRIFADQDYESRVRGGHNFFRVRASDTEINAPSEIVDILIALNKESIDLHHEEQLPALTKGPLVRQNIDSMKVEKLLEEFV